MVRVVNLRDEVGDRQLQTIGEGSKPLVLSNEAEPRPEIKKYVGDVAYDEVAIDEERGAKGAAASPGIFISFSISFVPPGWRAMSR